jgi:transposase
MDGMQQWPPEVVRLIKQFEQRVTQLEKENKELKSRITYLENKLKVYENPHTPSSMQRFKGRDGTKNPSGKRGAPPGHHGATRDRPEPEKIIPVTMDQCSQCGSYLGEAVDVESRTIEDLPPPQKITVTQYQLHTYICPGCGNTVTATHPDCPRVGDFGIRLLTHITMMKFHQRGVLRRIQESLQDQYRLQISPKGIHDILLRVGDALTPEYERLLQRIRAARWLHTDETSAPVNGKNHWLWCFRSDQDDILAVIRPSRGKKVLEEILGAEFQGAMVNDGYHSYRSMPIVQRCWAHLLREVDDFKEPMDHEQQLSEEMHQRFTMLKTFIGKDPPMQERVLQKESWDQELQRIVDEYCAYEDTRVKARYIQHGLGSWHTCLLYPGMQPTNNLAEQAIREHVIIRKIIGTFRSEKGSKNYECIASVLATWRLQGKNMSEELENSLRQELCFSKS